MATTHPSPMSDMRPPLPYVFDDCDFEVWFVDGHVDPVTMVVAVTLQWATDYSLKEASDLFATETPAEMVGRVEHLWFRQKPGDDEEMMEKCKADDEGAAPFTMLSYT